VIVATVAASVVYELRTSALQSWFFSNYARKMFYKVGPGPSPSIVFPRHGPFDIRTGYALIPEFQKRLESIGYVVTRQARFSPELERVAKWGILPPYSEPNSTKLMIQGMDGQALFQAPVEGYYFDSFEEVPPLAVKGLLMIENRELDGPADSRTNPVVDWDRLAKAAILYAGHKLGLPLPVEGGSTLATQMEKYRHSPEGRTDSILAKLRQMTDASLKVYQNGPDTREERRQIILDNLNSIPLAAAHPMRHRLLQEIADEESRYFLFQAYKGFGKSSPEDVIAQLLEKNAKSARHLSILFYAWHHGADEEALTSWLEKYQGRVTPEQIQHMVKAYGNPRLNLSDYGYLLGIHPLKVWCAGELARDPSINWDQLWDASSEARQISSTWLFKTRNRPAQNLRLRIRFEQDAFVRMTPQWRRFGFPFDRLVPSYATAIGSSGDRPEALAQLMGILINGGVRKPTIRMAQLRFAANTPYETTMNPARSDGKRLMPEAVARAILPVLSQVVQTGTAIRLAGAYKVGDKLLDVGGKTGSGDNRFDVFGHQGWVISSRPVDRTAVFVFHIEDRYFGVVTVFVPGKEAGEYGFTSSLPVAILKLLAPDIEKTWLQPKNGAVKNLFVSNTPENKARG
jgi:membrane peptidoglycan carboxypeptidase